MGFEPVYEVKDYSILSNARAFYDKGSDSLCLLNNDTIYKINEDKTTTELAYLPGRFNVYILPLESGKYAFLQSGNEKYISIRSLKTDTAIKENLRVISMYDDYLTKTARQRGDINLSVEMVDFLNLEDFASKLISGRLDYDIICLDTGLVDIGRLIEKGYVVEITSDKIKTFMQNAPGAISDIVSNNNRLYGLCAKNAFSMNFYNKKGFEDMNLQAPNTLLEYLKLALKYEKLEDKPYKFTSRGDYSYLDVRIVLNNYIYSMLADGNELSFNTEEFKQLMLQLKENLKGISVEEDNYLMLPDMEEARLIQRLNVRDISVIKHYMGDKKTDLEPLKMPLNLDGKPYIMAMPTYFLINPKSEKTELVQSLLEDYLDDMDEIAKINILGRAHEILAEDYEEKSQNIREHYDYITKRLKELSGAEKENFLEENRHFLDSYEAEMFNFKYEVDPKSAELFNKALEQKIIVSDSKNTRILDENITGYAFFQRFFDGFIDENQLAEELQNKLYLMQNENK